MGPDFNLCSPPLSIAVIHKELMEGVQGRLQETLGQVGTSTRTHLENMRQAWERERGASVENEQGLAVPVTAGHPPLVLGERVHPDLDYRVHKVTERLSETINIVANEPSLALYRIQEHVRKTLPQIIEKKQEVQTLHKKVQGSCFDTEYAVGALNSMASSRQNFQSIQDLLKNAMFIKQQIQYEAARKQQGRVRPSMYRASMMRTQTVDTTMSLSERRANEFSQSVQLPSTTSLDNIEDPQRARSASFDVRSSAAEVTQHNSTALHANTSETSGAISESNSNNESKNSDQGAT